MTEKLIHNVVNAFTKKSNLTGQQEERIVETLEEDTNMSFQEMSKFLSKKIKAKEQDIYDFLLNYEKSKGRDINKNKIQ